jgi:hypothetical protein
MVIDTEFMDEPREPNLSDHNTTNEFDEDSSSAVLLTIGIVGIVALNFGFRCYRAFCMRIRDRGNEGRYVRAPETIISRIVDVSEPTEIEAMGMCPICLESLSGTDIEDQGQEDDVSPRTAIKLNCGHVFHRECLHEWLHKNMSCPICRETV